MSIYKLVIINGERMDCYQDIQLDGRSLATGMMTIRQSIAVDNQKCILMTYSELFGTIQSEQISDAEASRWFLDQDMEVPISIIDRLDYADNSRPRYSDEPVERTRVHFYDKKGRSRWRWKETGRLAPKPGMADIRYDSLGRPRDDTNKPIPRKSYRHDTQSLKFN